MGIYKRYNLIADIRNDRIIFENKYNNNIRIIQSRKYGGAWEEPLINIFEAYEFFPGLIYVKEIGTNKIDRDEWLPVTEKGH